MKCASCERCPMALVMRWAGRLLGLAAIAFVAWFLVAHIAAGDPPRPFAMSANELGLGLTLVGALAGMAIGWRWEWIGGLLVLAAMFAFFAIERMATGTWPGGWVIWLFPVPGVLFLLAAGFETCRTRHLRVTP